MDSPLLIAVVERFEQRPDAVGGWRGCYILAHLEILILLAYLGRLYYAGGT